MASQSATIIQGGPTSSKQQVCIFHHVLSVHNLYISEKYEEILILICFNLNHSPKLHTPSTYFICKLYSNKLNINAFNLICNCCNMTLQNSPSVSQSVSPDLIRVGFWWIWDPQRSVCRWFTHKHNFISSTAHLPQSGVGTWNEHQSHFIVKSSMAQLLLETKQMMLSQKIERSDYFLPHCFTWLIFKLPLRFHVPSCVRSISFATSQRHWWLLITRIEGHL